MDSSASTQTSSAVTARKEHEAAEEREVAKRHKTPRSQWITVPTGKTLAEHLGH